MGFRSRLKRKVKRMGGKSSRTVTRYVPDPNLIAQVNAANQQCQAIQAQMNNLQKEQNQKISSLNAAHQQEVKEQNQKISSLNAAHQQEMQSQRKIKEQLEKQQRELKSEMSKLKELEEKRRKEAELLRKYPPQPFQMTETFKNSCNIGFVGGSGAGKSTLINTVRGLKSRDEGAARVSHGVEGTMAPTPYDWKFNGDPVQLWDLPGTGTPRFPMETYLRDMGLRYFSCVMVITRNRFTEADLKLMNELEEHKIPYIMVRSKIDQICISAEAEGDDPKKAIDEIRRNLLAQGIKKVYCIQGFLSGVAKFDFPELREAIPIMCGTSNPVAI